MVLVIILTMSKSGFEDEVLIKSILNSFFVGVVKHVTMSPLMSLDLSPIEAAIDFCRKQLRRESQ
jgi:hypothetical protein